MKKRSINLVTILFIILLSIPLKLVSQESAISKNDQMRIGFGVGFGQTNIFGSGGDLASVALPIDFSNFSVVFRKENFRIEPSLGYFSYSSSSDNDEYSSSNFRIGSIFALASSRGSMNYYYGIDIGAVFGSTTDNSWTDFYIGAVTGGEYMFSDNFSLGGEIQLSYISIGQSGDNDSNRSESFISTKSMVILRWYVQ
jgi:hypothetical protein